MNVELHLTEPYWRVVGQRRLLLELEKESTISALFTHLSKQYPELPREMEENQFVLFINEDEGSMDSVLQDGDHIHLVWPITGG